MKTNKNSVRRSLIVSATALVLTVAMLIGTTFAWFTDSVTSGKNKIVAGNLDVELEYYDTTDSKWKSVTDQTTLFSALEDENGKAANLWEPNHTEVAYLRVRNAGTLALNYTLNVTPIDELGGINQADKPFKLSDFLVFGEKKYDAQTIYTGTAAEAREAAQKDAGATLGLVQDKMQVTGTLEPETNGKVYKYLNLIIYMPYDVGNDANAKTGTDPASIDFGLTLYATQAESEKDSFGSDYDASADLSPDNGGKDATSSTYTPQVNQTATITRGDDNAITSVTGAELSENSDTITITSDAKVDGTAAAVAKVPTDAIAGDADNITLSVTKGTKDDSIQVNTDSQAYTALDVNVEGVDTNNDKLIEVKFYIGKSLKNLELYHKTVKMVENDALNDEDTYKYDSATGFVTIAVKHFSDFTVVYDAPVAIVNGTYYNTLTEAVNAITTTGTITMNNDADVSTANLTIPAGKTIMLDLAGHSLKSTNVNAYNIKVEGNLTVRDSVGTGKIYSETAYVYNKIDNCVLVARGNGVFTLESGLIEAVMDDPHNQGQFGIGVYNNATVNIKGGTIKAGWYTVAGNGSDKGSNTTINVYGGELISVDDYAIYNPQNGTVNIYGGVVDGAAGGIQMNRGTLNVTGGTVASQGTGDTGNWGDGTGGTTNAAIHLNAKYGDVTAVIDSGATLIAKNDAVEITLGEKYGKNYTVNLSGTHPAIQNMITE